MLSKQQIVTALSAWIRQRPGLEFGNYGELSSYRAELRQIARDKRDAEALLTAVAIRDSITAEDMLKGFRAYSGRLTISEKNGRAVLNYCTGQYWPTEYRKAAAAVLASVLWERKRADMPPAEFEVERREFATMKEAQTYANSLLPNIVEIRETYRGKRAGDWLRDSFKREFGRSIQQRWFS
jgi:hypothetical protein